MQDQHFVLLSQPQETELSLLYCARLQEGGHCNTDCSRVLKPLSLLNPMNGKTAAEAAGWRALRAAGLGRWALQQRRAPQTIATNHSSSGSRLPQVLAL